MSTRCQVRIRETGLAWSGKEERTLYHHTDGYPEFILPLIEEAYQKYGQDWRGGRAGKVASFLCAVDPGVFEPEEAHHLHGDIKYYYLLDVINEIKGCIAEKPKWNITIKTPKSGFWDNPTVDNMKTLRGFNNIPIVEAIKKISKD